MPASTRNPRNRRWLGWVFLGLFWLVQVLAAAWFVGYQIMLGRPDEMTGDFKSVAIILAWLMATIASGVLVLLVPPPPSPAGRAKRVP